MNQIMSWFTDKLAPGMQKIFSNPWVGAVASAMQKILPFILVGSVVSIYNVFELPFSYHKSRDSGDLIQRSTSDIETVRRFLANQFSEMLFAILNVTLASLILFSNSTKVIERDYHARKYYT